MFLPATCHRCALEDPKQSLITNVLQKPRASMRVWCCNFTSPLGNSDDSSCLRTTSYRWPSQHISRTGTPTLPNLSILWLMAIGPERKVLESLNCTTWFPSAQGNRNLNPNSWAWNMIGTRTLWPSNPHFCSLRGPNSSCLSSRMWKSSPQLEGSTDF